ncbi:hypothetical protein BH09BAC6_BH09BAC6_13110 [soil metagenome]|jgi:hypothetical protein
MKKTFTLSALFVLLTAGLMAATPVKAAIVPFTDVVTFTTLAANNGVAVKIAKSEAGKISIVIYDKDKNVLRKDVLGSSQTGEKGYILTSLDNGDYTIEVTSNKKVVTKEVHIYNEDQSKMFIIQ